MPNIMITQKCNLGCVYCFADEFVSEREERADISLSAFREAVDFIVSDGRVRKIGLIGGEPTIHPQFGELLDILASDERIEGVTVYTNGIKVKEHIRQLSNDKFHLLINCNDMRHRSGRHAAFMESMEAVGEAMPSRAVLGVNYYRIGFDYDFLWEVIEKYKGEKLRVSISVPNMAGYTYAPLEYFRRIKPEVFAFFHKLKKKGIIPFFDCNFLPACLLSYDDWTQFEGWGADNPLLALKSGRSVCRPVIDILPDGTAVRCFGLSEYTRVKFHDFANITDLRNYYLRTVDAYAVNSSYDAACERCYQHKTVKCSGGCLIYKIEKILEKRQENG